MGSLLDPSAQEFRPTYCLVTAAPIPTQIPIFRASPPQLFYPYTPQTVAFVDTSVGFPQYPAPVLPTYVVQQPSLAPPSTAATRSLLLSSVLSDVSETLVRRELEVFGEVRGVQMERVLDGIVTVHFYDLRDAERALKEIREQHMQQQTRLKNHYMSLATLGPGGESNAFPPQPPPARGLVAGRAVWAHFVVPSCNAVPSGNNQGTVVVFNLDSAVSSSELKENFQSFGAIKELRETPGKKNQRFVEFYDVRDAAKALKELNGKEINGRQIVIEFSRPGGHTGKLINKAAVTASATIHSKNIVTSSPRPRHQRYLPPPPPPPFKFSSHLPSNVSPGSFLSQKRPSTIKSPNPGTPNGNSSRCISVEASMGKLSLSVGSGDEIEKKAGNGIPKKSAKKNHNSSSTASSSKQQYSRNRPWKSKQVKRFDPRFLISQDVMIEADSRDSRTTVMIKNIPNKYSQKLLLNMLDNHCIHCNEQISDGDDQPLSAYDFVYLPIDFNNKCNVGYGFVNMTSPEATWRLYKAFHHQHWEVFNSRKICEVTYARVQGVEALKDHFKDSKFPCELDHYLPVVFSPPRDGKQLTEPVPIVGPKKEKKQIVCCDDSSKSTTATTDDEEDDVTAGSSDSQQQASIITDSANHSTCISVPVD
ncbi:hypothetical protein SLE2022_046940 [Rubroshorea leprosula]